MLIIFALGREIVSTNAFDKEHQTSFIVDLLEASCFTVPTSIMIDTRLQGSIALHSRNSSNLDPFDEVELYINTISYIPGVADVCYVFGRFSQTNRTCQQIAWPVTWTQRSVSEVYTADIDINFAAIYGYFDRFVFCIQSVDHKSSFSGEITLRNNGNTTNSKAMRYPSRQLASTSSSFDESLASIYPSVASVDVSPVVPSYSGRYQTAATVATVTCPAFSASATSSATVNYVPCLISLCTGDVAVFSLCSSRGGVCSGDTYLRLFTSGGNQVSADDDYCAPCSQITYTATACDTYSLRQGCFGSGSCSGTTSVATTLASTHTPTLAPSPQPSITFQPTSPTESPQS